MRNWKEISCVTVLTILCIACFPLNPLVLAGVIEVNSYLVLNILGGIVWVFGMVLVMAPIVMFPRRGGVAKGNTFVKTTRLVDTGIYSILRHPQYTGGIYAIFLTTLLLYPHWIFGLLGVLGTLLIYQGIRVEDKLLIEKFGDDYIAYQQRVPGMNFVVGIIRLLHRRVKLNHNP